MASWEDDLRWSKHKKIGVKQTARAVANGVARKVFVAEDADKHVVSELLELCRKKDIEVVHVESMKTLGRTCGIDVRAAVAVLLYET